MRQIFYYSRKLLGKLKHVRGKGCQFAKITVNKLSLVKSSDFMKFILYLFKAAKHNSKNLIGQCWTVNLWNNLESFLKLSPFVKILQRSLRASF